MLCKLNGFIRIGEMPDQVRDLGVAQGVAHQKVLSIHQTGAPKLLIPVELLGFANAKLSTGLLRPLAVMRLTYLT